MGIIFLVRHGQATFNSGNYDRLSDLGQRQARVLGDFFAQTGKSFDGCYSGSMERQSATARIICHRMEQSRVRLLETVPELNEHDTVAILKAHFPELTKENPSLNEAISSFSTDRNEMWGMFDTAMLRWARGEQKAPGLESFSEFTARVRRGMTRIAGGLGPKQKALVVSSGGPISAVMQWALGLSNENTIRLSWRVRNASVSIFKISAERAELLSFNSLAHFEMQNDPSLLSIV